MRMLNKYILLVKIYLYKRDMYNNAKRFGFVDPRVVACSQRLDELLNTYQQLNDANFQMPTQRATQFMNYR
ncbi:aspartyl-phosphate phosphatase Spo0E family protein [Paenisporosarcina indica]|uniref:aspartyl-phosphate phosphatase Spo0E family protein n=1 Tax=Paenisporosarcina indica TaxID=650093 RepID=UPI000B0908DE